MPRRSPGPIILTALAGVALALTSPEAAVAQRSASASIGVRAVIAPLVTGPTASELTEPTERLAAVRIADRPTAGTRTAGERIETARTNASDSPVPMRATGGGAPTATPPTQTGARTEAAEPQRYLAVVRLDGVDGAGGVPLHVRDASGHPRDLAREAAVLVSDAPAVEVRRALARLLASTARRSVRVASPKSPASPASADDAPASTAAGTTIRLTLEVTPATMLTQ